MAELTTAEAPDPCCTAAAQAACCEPSEKAGCCQADESCACAAGDADLRENVRRRYAAAAKAADPRPGCGCGSGGSDDARFDGALYDPAEAGYRNALTAAGLTDVDIRPTHRVHRHASSASVRARKPLANGAP